MKSTNSCLSISALRDTARVAYTGRLSFNTAYWALANRIKFFEITASMELSEFGIKMFGAMIPVTFKLLWKVNAAASSFSIWLSRSMTGYAQVRGQANARLAFALSLKAVNHRFLDLHFRLPSDTDSLEMKLRRLLKEKLARGHVEVALSLDYSGTNGVALNRQLLAGYVQTFRAAAEEFGIKGEPDLNVVLRMPGAMDSGTERFGPELETAVMSCVDEALARLNQMREEEGRGIERELRERMKHLRAATGGVEVHRSAILRGYADRLQSRMREMLGSQFDKDRILQEAAMLVDRSDIQEELVRLNTHVDHFVALLDQAGEVGKKMDFLLQEMNREANTLLSKTSGLAGEALKITEAGLLIKSEIEKSREQVQNLE